MLPKIPTPRMNAVYMRIHMIMSKEKKTIKKV